MSNDYPRANASMGAATILQIIPRLDTGGAERTTVEMTQALTGVGARALVVTEGGRLCDEIRCHGGTIIPFPAATKNPLRLMANARLLARLLRDEKVDLVHARSRAPAWSALLAARARHIPFVTTYHGIYGSRGAAKTFYNGVMARGDRVIANSRYTAELIKARHGTPAERIRIIHRGVDLARFDPARVETARLGKLRQAWGVRDGERVVLHAARLTAWKGQRVVIDAAAELQAQGTLSGTVFLLAGDAQGRESYAAELRSRIETAGLQDKIRLVGHCADMPAAYAMAHVTVVPSIEAEAFGRVSAEAQAMGCPVIASNLGASPEVVRVARQAGETATGWLVPAGDAGALAAAIAHALALPEGEREAMGIAARAHVMRSFSVDALRRATLAVYDELLGTSLAAAYKETLWP